MLIILYTRGMLGLPIHKYIVVRVLHSKGYFQHSYWQVVVENKTFGLLVISFKYFPHSCFNIFTGNLKHMFIIYQVFMEIIMRQQIYRFI